MNERIEEFYSQVGLDFENFQRVTVKKGDMEKFAELIVRDCTRICAKQAWESRTNDDWTEYNALSRVAGQIKRHFGVEE